MLDLVFAIFRVSKSQPLPAFCQQYARGTGVFVCWPLAPKGHWIMTPILVAWSIADINRFLLYVLKEFGIDHKNDSFGYAVAAARYTIFIVNYPVGWATETYADYLAYSTICELVKKGERAPWSIEMPNTFNFAFDSKLFSMTFPI